MKTSNLIASFEELIRDVEKLRAELEVSNMREASASLFTIEQDLIWQLYEIRKFEAS